MATQLDTHHYNNKNSYLSCVNPPSHNITFMNDHHECSFTTETALNGLQKPLDFVQVDPTSSQARVPSRGIEIRSENELLSSSSHVRQPDASLLKEKPNQVVWNVKETPPWHSGEFCKGNIFYHSEINRRYVVQSILGRGAFGLVVRCAEETVNGSFIREVAVKVIRKHPAYLNQAAMEVKTLMRLAEMYPNCESLHVTKLYDCFIWNGRLCIVLHRLGDTLYQVMRSRGFASLPIGFIQHCTSQICLSLTLLSASKIIHCDIKPENIMIGHESSSSRFCKPPPPNLAKHIIPQFRLQNASLSFCSLSEKGHHGDNFGTARKSSMDPYHTSCQPCSSARGDHHRDEATTTTLSSMIAPPPRTLIVNAEQTATTTTTTTIINNNKWKTPSKQAGTTTPDHREASHQHLNEMEHLLNSFAPVTLIDFGSAAFESKSLAGYVQSRYYRAPEVILGIPYSYGVDIWSLGCVLAELYLGIPLFGGIDEFDQLRRIVTLVGAPPDWLLQRATRTLIFFNQKIGCSCTKTTSSFEYRASPLGRKVKEGLSRKNREFQSLDELVHAVPLKTDDWKEIESRLLLIDFLKQALDPNPFTRISAYEALRHPFVQYGFKVELIGRTFLQLTQLCKGLKVKRPDFDVVTTEDMFGLTVIQSLGQSGKRAIDRLTEKSIAKAIRSKLSKFYFVLTRAGSGSWRTPPVARATFRQLMARPPQFLPVACKSKPFERRDENEFGSAFIGGSALFSGGGQPPNAGELVLTNELPCKAEGSIEKKRASYLLTTHQSNLGSPYVNPNPMSIAKTVANVHKVFAYDSSCNHSDQQENIVESEDMQYMPPAALARLSCIHHGIFRNEDSVGLSDQARSQVQSSPRHPSRASSVCVAELIIQGNPCNSSTCPTGAEKFEIDAASLAITPSNVFFATGNNGEQPAFSPINGTFSDALPSAYL